MLIITGAMESHTPCNLEIDLYVPLCFEAYAGLLPGAKLYRIGNFDTSLLEMKINPFTHVLSGVCLLIFDQIIPTPQLKCVEELVERHGLPIVDPKSLTGDRTDTCCDFAVCLSGNSFIIDWSENKTFSSVLLHNNVRFYLVNDQLRRISFVDLETSEIEILRRHIVAKEKGWGQEG